jgi:membrane-associated HD superfamily phosphohydrolase
MTMAYFLHRARQGSGPDGLRRGEIDLSLYAYPGPKPQSKETALLMLADGCESAVRASSDHAQEKIEETVRRIFEERIQQGQLDECPLTLQDLESARKTFCSVLNGLYHPRIEYPEGVEPVVDSASRFVDQSQSQRREGA